MASSTSIDYLLIVVVELLSGLGTGPLPSASRRCINYTITHMLSGNIFFGGTMGRDVITEADAAAERERVAKATAASLPSGPRPDRLLGGYPDPANATDALLVPDSWNQRLLKYIPAEAMGFYLALDRAVHTAPAFSDGLHPTLLAIWLAAALAAAALFNVLYLVQIWQVRRAAQIGVSTIALITYVYALSGAFEPLGWAYPTAQLISVIVIAAFLAFFKPPGPIPGSRAVSPKA